MRLIFFGTADLARPSLAALAADSAYQVAAVITQPDRPKGRELKLQPSPVKQEALARGLPVLQPERVKSPDFIGVLSALAPELCVVVAYGQILPRAILDLPRHGCLNVHASLLPKYRGAAPIQWAILQDEAETGVTIMRMDAGLDTGDIVSQESTPIESSDDAQSLHDRLARVGSKLLMTTIPGYVSGQLPPHQQPAEGASYARKVTKQDGLLDWNQAARTLFNRVRALTPWPGAYTYAGDQGRSTMLKIWAAELASVAPESSSRPGQILRADKTGIMVRCQDGALRIRTIQREGARRMSVGEFLLGCPLHPGEQLGGS